MPNYTREDVLSDWDEWDDEDPFGVWLGFRSTGKGFAVSRLGQNAALRRLRVIRVDQGGTHGRPRAQSEGR